MEADLNPERLSLALSSPSEICMGEGALERAGACAKGRRVFVVTDTTVQKLYGARIAEIFPGATVRAFPAGERSKNAKTLFSLIGAMAESGLERRDLVCAVGGGVVGDVGGLAAALYMRGVELMQIPTTLLAQVDSSVGGKTAVDVAGIKNLAGAFYQPRNVFIDPVFLATLPMREIRCGLGEIVKTAALDAALFEKLRKGRARLFDRTFLAETARDAVRVKARVVEADERETGGQRKTLNVGHTLGHAAEMCLKNRSHGQCVMWGMRLERAVTAGEVAGDAEYLAQLDRILVRAAGKIPRFSAQQAAQIALHDKKNANGRVVMIVPVRPGETAEVSLSAEEVARRLAQIGETL